MIHELRARLNAPARHRLNAVSRIHPARRHARPILEYMEPRTLLANAAGPLIIASLGDSLTDEYQFYGAATPTLPSYPATMASQSTTLPPNIYLTGRDAARNFVEQIGATLSSQLSFGNFTTQSRGMTRNQGYQENWAENGTTASGPDVSGTATTFEEEFNGIPPEFSQGVDPTPGLVTQTSADIPIGQINVVTFLIGANDYNAALAAYTDQTDKLDTSVFDTANTNIENAISTAISTIQTAATVAGNPSIKFLVITTPNITVAPLIQDEAGSTALPALKVIIGEKIDALDLNLATTYVGNPAVGLIDSTAIINQFIADPVIDGVTVNMEGAGQDYTDGFIGDGFHPGTIVQGLFTQAMVNTINNLEGAQVVTPVTDADIVNYAESSQPSLAFSSSTTTSTVGQAITLKADLTPSPNGQAISTGTVTFEVIVPATSSTPAFPGLILGTVPLNPAGSAALTVKDLPPGTYPIAAIFNGDRNTEARLSTTLTQTVVTTLAPTATVLYSSANPVSPGVPVTFTATVTPQGPGLPVPSGTVMFLDQSTNQILGTATVNDQGVATCTATFTTNGPHPIVATYDGTLVLARSSSTPLVELVAPNLATTIRVMAKRFMAHGTPWVGLTVIVSPVDPAAGMPTGTITLSLGTYHFRKLKLRSGTAHMNVRLAAVAHHIVSSYYPGNGFLYASGSPFVKLSPPR